MDGGKLVSEVWVIVKLRSWVISQKSRGGRTETHGWLVIKSCLGVHAVK